MAIEVNEKVESRGYKDNAADQWFERVFVIDGTEDPYVAKAYGPQVGDTYGAGLIVDDRLINPLLGTGACHSVIRYRSPELAAKEEPLSGEVELEVSAETENIIRAEFGQTHYPDGDDVGDLIGVDGENVTGVDKRVPKSQFVLDYDVNELALTATYWHRITDFSGTVNNATWKIWAKGEVLFLGARIVRRGKGENRARYTFLVSPNETIQIETTSGVQSVVKGGWEYLWLERLKTTSDGRIKMEVKAVHVAKIYEASNFLQLGIG